MKNKTASASYEQNTIKIVTGFVASAMLILVTSFAVADQPPASTMPAPLTSTYTSFFAP